MPLGNKEEMNMIFKKPQFIIFILLFIIACEPSERELAKKRKADSLNIARQDSISIEQEKVVGDIRFGMDKETTEKLWEKFCKEHKVSEDFGTGLKDNYYIYLIGEYQFSNHSIYLNPITPRYYNDSLYHFTIRGRSSNLDFLMNMLSKKFGQPKSLPEEIQPYSSTLMYWTIGEKRIDIVLNDDANLNLVIYKPKYLKKARKNEEQISDEKANEAKEVF